jgi:hypothetical protein
MYPGFGDALFSASSSSCIRSCRFTNDPLLCRDGPRDIPETDVVGLEPNIKSCEGPGLIDNKDDDEDEPTPAYEEK